MQKKLASLPPSKYNKTLLYDIFVFR